MRTQPHLASDANLKLGGRQTVGWVTGRTSSLEKILELQSSKVVSFVRSMGDPALPGGISRKLCQVNKK